MVFGVKKKKKEEFFRSLILNQKYMCKTFGNIQIQSNSEN